MKITFKIDGEHIEMIKLLKVTGLCESGGMAKAVVDEGHVKVDNQIEFRKRCKIRKGQFVTFEGHTIAVE